MATETTAVQLNHRDIIATLEHDGEFFINFFLGDELTFPVPQFHKDIFDMLTMIEITRIVLAIPRDHAKTTLAKLTVVWYFLFSDYRFIVYLSNTTKIAIPAANDIISFMESENFKAVFGELVWITRQDGVGFYKFKLGDKLCILRAMGAGQQVRGINVDNKRPQLAVVDDLEDNDNIATEPLFINLKRWVYGPFRKALDKFHNKIIWLGNMISAQSMLAENCQSEYWYSRLYGCLLADGTALWPDAWPIEKLMQDFKEYKEAGMADIWFAEMMNMPTAMGNGIIMADEINYKPEQVPGDCKYGFITVDLALSAETWAHKTVVAAHGWVESDVNDEGGYWQVVEINGYHGIDPVALFDELLILAMRWRFCVIGIENVAFQDSLQYIYPHFCLQRGITDLKFVPLKATKRKVQRIAPWAAMLKSGDYAINEGDFVITQQLLSFDPQKKTNKDDYVDCCAHGVQMIDNYMHDIMQDMLASENKHVQSCYQLEQQTRNNSHGI